MTFKGPLQDKIFHNSIILGTTDDLPLQPHTLIHFNSKVRSVFKKLTNESYFNNLIMEFKLTAMK